MDARFQPGNGSCLIASRLWSMFWHRHCVARHLVSSSYFRDNSISTLLYGKQLDHSAVLANQSESLTRPDEISFLRFVVEISGVRVKYRTWQYFSRKSNFPTQSSPMTNTSALYFTTSSTFCSQFSSGNTWSTGLSAETMAARSSYGCMHSLFLPRL